MEELDAPGATAVNSPSQRTGLANHLPNCPGEWMFDPTSKKLHFYPNSTTPGKDIVAPVLAAIFRIEGAKGVSISGFKLTETRATFLEQYEVPSGGDWSVHRGATVEIVDSSDVTVSNCTFDQVGSSSCASGCSSSSSLLSSSLLSSRALTRVSASDRRQRRAAVEQRAEQQHQRQRVRLHGRLGRGLGRIERGDHRHRADLPAAQHHQQQPHA